VTEIHQIPRGVLAPAISDDAEFDRALFGQIQTGDWRMVIGDWFDWDRTWSFVIGD